MYRLLGGPEDAQHFEPEHRLGKLQDNQKAEIKGVVRKHTTCISDWAEGRESEDSV